MDFAQAIKSVWGQYATFSGRAPRSEYWWWFLFVCLLNIVTQTLDAFIVAPMLGFGMANDFAVQPLTLIMTLGLLIPGLAVSIRRLHDKDRTGWWVLIAFVPIVGLIVLLIWFVTRGTEGANNYGDDPLRGM